MIIFIRTRLEDSIMNPLTFEDLEKTKPKPSVRMRTNKCVVKLVVTRAHAMIREAGHNLM